MNLRKQKELAARALGVSKERVKFIIKTPEDLKEVSELISRDGVKELVEKGIIVKLPKKGISRTRANKIAEQKKKGRRQGRGSRKGTANARFKEKLRWMIRIRALRSELKKLKLEGKLDVKVYRELYKKAKGNFFRSKRHMRLYMQQHDLLKDSSEKINSSEVNSE